MKKKLINLVLLLVILVSCDNSSRSTRKKVAHRVISGVIKTLESRYNMKCIGLGEGGGAPGYNFVGLGFLKKEVISKDEGRRLLVASAYELLNEINKDAELQEYLLDRPFTEKNVDIGILIEKENNENVYYPDIMFFSAHKGTIFYRTKSPDQEFGYKTKESETFEESVNIVESQKQFAE